MNKPLDQLQSGNAELAGKQGVLEPVAPAKRRSKTLNHGGTMAAASSHPPAEGRSA